MKAEEKGSHKERVEAMQKKFDVSTRTHIPPMNTYIVHICIFVHINEIVLCTNITKHNNNTCMYVQLLCIELRMSQNSEWEYFACGALGSCSIM